MMIFHKNKAIFLVILLAFYSETGSAEANPLDDNFYTRLGLSRDASETDIKKAYRRLVLLWHPDKRAQKGLPNADTEFKNLNEANEALTDPGRRSDYNNLLDEAAARRRTATTIPRSHPSGGSRTSEQTPWWQTDWENTQADMDRVWRMYRNRPTPAPAAYTYSAPPPRPAAARRPATNPEQTFWVGERVRVRDSFYDDWMQGTVTQTPTVRSLDVLVRPDGRRDSVRWAYIEKLTAARRREMRQQQQQREQQDRAARAAAAAVFEREQQQRQQREQERDSCESYIRPDYFSNTAGKSGIPRNERKHDDYVSVSCAAGYSGSVMFKCSYGSWTRSSGLCSRNTTWDGIRPPAAPAAPRRHTTPRGSTPTTRGDDTASKSSDTSFWLWIVGVAGFIGVIAIGLAIVKCRRRKREAKLLEAATPINAYHARPNVIPLPYPTQTPSTATRHPQPSAPPYLLSDARQDA